MYALVDCNSFFCSVERVFHPGLKDKPVVVLSSNDGIIVALTPEAKAIGLHRGDRAFEVQKTIQKYGVEVFSTNMMLYAAMSKRITSILRQSVARVENYSIDESFCDLRGYEKHYDLVELMRDVRERIRLWTDIPVSIGIAPTKTLAKMGSKYAKQYKGYRGVCLIDTEIKRRKALELFDLADIWGIGRQTYARLAACGIRTPLEFADRSGAWVRANLTKPGVQTWLELNGTPCIDTAEVLRNKTICTSRSFGKMVSDLESLKASVATFAASSANKLRAQASSAGAVSVFICSNTFREDLPQYGNGATIPLLNPTSDTLEITEAALTVLKGIYRKGIQYKRAGVVLSGIVPNECVQADLFDPVRNRTERRCLMEEMDAINQRYGVKTLHLAVEGPAKQDWKSKSEHRSRNYLTDLNDLLTIHI